MSKKRNEILVLQDEYLQTEDPVLLKALYLKLVNLGVAIQRRDEKIINEDAALDVAADVCIRLMERKAQVIGSSPSAYVKQAMFYKGRIKHPLEDIDAIREVVPYNEPQGQSYEHYSKSLLRKTGLDLKTEVGQLVQQTIESCVDWHKVWQSIKDPKIKVRYYRAMRSVRKNANENL